MRRLRVPAALALLCLVVLLSAGSGAGARVPAAPKGFFGIAPQTVLSAEDARYMAAGGIESVRLPISWENVQPTRTGGYDWTEVDQTVAVASRAGLGVLPFFWGTPRWLAAKPTTMPLNGRQRSAWVALLKAAVKRYGPGGEFWATHAQEGPGPTYEPAINPPVPVRTWQIWNEANFFYFAYPVSPQRYAQLLTLSSKTIKSVDPRAKILLTGLFARPRASGKRGMEATKFLQQLYRVPGIKSRFDGIALHPYAVDADELEEMVEELNEVKLDARDRATGLYITEMGWGSQNNFRQVAFEQGPQGQVRQLRDSYRYLLENRTRLNVKAAYWFSWKDVAGSCTFCDSVGLFRAGKKFKPKPAWRVFTGIAGGRVRP